MDRAGASGRKPRGRAARALALASVLSLIGCEAIPVAPFRDAGRDPDRDSSGAVGLGEDADSLTEASRAGDSCGPPQCTLGQASCTDGMTAACLADERGCPNYRQVARCEAGCDDAGLWCDRCDDQCRPMERQCTDETHERFCVADEHGCWRWSPPQNCADLDHCTTDRCNADVGECEHLIADSACEPARSTAGDDETPTVELPIPATPCDERGTQHCIEAGSPRYLRCDGVRWFEDNCGSELGAYCETPEGPGSARCAYRTDSQCGGVADGGRVCIGKHVHACMAGRSWRLSTCGGNTPGCVKGSCECSDRCDGLCANLSEDRTNCGRCGNACPAEYSCSLGQCEPALFTSLVGSREIAVEGSQLYWLSREGAIGRVSIATRDEVTLVERPDSVHGLSTDQTHIYWVEGGKIMRSKLDGSALTMLASSRPQPYELAVGASSLYWLEASREPNGAISESTLAKVDKNGGAVTTLATTLPASALVVAGRDVYFVVGRNVARMSISGGEINLLASGFSPWALAADAAHLYMVARSGVLARVPRAGGDVVELDRERVDYGAGVAVDATHVYYVHNDSLVRQPVGGGARETLHNKVLKRGLQIELADDHVYYLDLDRENIYRVRKP